MYYVRTYIDYDAVYMYVQRFASGRLRVASFFTQPATRVGTVRRKHNTKKRRKQRINLDDSEDDDTDGSDDSTQNTHTDSAHTHMNVTYTTDDAHRRGHAPSVQQLGRTMPTRDNEGGGETWDGSEYYMDI